VIKPASFLQAMILFVVAGTMAAFGIMMIAFIGILIVEYFGIALRKFGVIPTSPAEKAWWK
jgi:hypothetical protein